MDAELKQHLEELEARLTAGSQQMEARLAARHQELEGRLAAQIQELGARITAQNQELEGRIMERVGGRIDAAEERLKAHTSSECERIETKLLTEFHKWGRTADMRTKQALDASYTMNDPLMNAEDRITTLERSRVAPPAAEAA